jgi:hypothetical protein
VRSREVYLLEMNGAKERSTMLFALLGLMLATLLCINTALLIVPVFIGTPPPGTHS